MGTHSPSRAHRTAVYTHLAQVGYTLLQGTCRALAVKIMVGDGAGPPVDHGAIEK
jgi:hypothetical protein